MKTHKQPSATESVDRMMLRFLKKEGAQYLDDIATLSGIGWSQVFLAIDRLSRIGRVSLTPVRPCGYRVSLTELLHH
jgi:hypothetical protein